MWLNHKHIGNDRRNIVERIEIHCLAPIEWNNCNQQIMKTNEEDIDTPARSLKWWWSYLRPPPPRGSILTDAIVACQSGPEANGTSPDLAENNVNSPLRSEKTKLGGGKNRRHWHRGQGKPSTSRSYLKLNYRKQGNLELARITSSKKSQPTSILVWREKQRFSLSFLFWLKLFSLF